MDQIAGRLHIKWPFYMLIEIVPKNFQQNWQKIQSRLQIEFRKPVGVQVHHLEHSFTMLMTMIQILKKCSLIWQNRQRSCWDSYLMSSLPKEKIYPKFAGNPTTLELRTLAVTNNSHKFSALNLQKQNF